VALVVSGVAPGLGSGFGISAASAAVPSAVSRIALPAGFTTLQYGQRSDRVHWVQGVLRVTPRTGYFGPITRDAVRRFQAAKGLQVTGKVTASTMRYLIYVSRLAAAAPASTTSTQAARILSAAATTARGATYRYGATGPSSFDCSGYVGQVVRTATGKRLPRTSYQMRAALPRLAASSVRPGDLVFVHGGSGGRVSHVAIYAGSGAWWEAGSTRSGVGLHKAWSRNVSYGRP
jgi:cell wall-associated NlpC family hydrolase